MDSSVKLGDDFGPMNGAWTRERRLLRTALGWPIWAPDRPRRTSTRLLNNWAMTRTATCSQQIGDFYSLHGHERDRLLALPLKPISPR